MEGCLEMLLCERGWVMAPHLLPCSGCPGDICDARLLGSGGEGWPLPISVSLSLTPLTHAHTYAPSFTGWPLRLSHSVPWACNVSGLP